MMDVDDATPRSPRWRQQAAVISAAEDEASLDLSEVVRSMENITSNHGPPNEIIAERETRHVVFLKVLVIFLLLVVGVGLSVTALLITRNVEANQYRSEYNLYAEKMFLYFHETGRVRVWTAYSIATAYTSEMRRTPEQWPNVTLLDFEERVVGASHVAKSDVISFSPLVTSEKRKGWEEYATQHISWLHDSMGAAQVQVDGTTSFLEDVGNTGTRNGTSTAGPDLCVGEKPPPSGCRRVSEGIWISDANSTPVNMTGDGPFLPCWQVAPFAYTHNRSSPNSRFVLRDNAAVSFFKKAAFTVLEKEEPGLSETVYNPTTEEPLAAILHPVFDSFDNTSRKVVGVITIRFEWKNFFENILPPDAGSLVVILNNTCGQAFTYEVDGNDATFIGSGDWHDPTFDGVSHLCLWQRMQTVPTLWTPGFHPIEGGVLSDEDNPQCYYQISIYPSESFQESFETIYPTVIASSVACIFAFTVAVFLLYDYLVERRQSTLLQIATRSNAIVDSLFPAKFRDRIYQDSGSGGILRRSWRMSEDTTKTIHREQSVSKNLLTRTMSRKNVLPRLRQNPKRLLKSFLSGDGVSTGTLGEDDSEPIAELFNDTTVMFADIAGFTAWSSEREPTQVFLLLETIYRAFDVVATKLGVFKVETIGDCYVAVTGLPDPNENHAVVMTWFASECIRQMKALVKDLEVSLGPGTSDLTLRVGMHSGPVTAGILRGQKSRFQLFGDTVNTAARMESTSLPNLIHTSYESVQLLIASGKVGWVTPRDDLIHTKGKGDMKTYWIKPRHGSSRGGNSSSNLHDSSSCGSSTMDSRPKHNTPFPKGPGTIFKSIGSASNTQVESMRWGNASLEEALPTRAATSSQKRASQKRSRLVQWNVDLLLGFLAKLVSYRNHKEGMNKRRRRSIDRTSSGISAVDTVSTTILEEVTEIIVLPDFDERTTSSTAEVLLPPAIRAQLHDFVTRIASRYRDNPFHNLEHASHVTMSAVKLMKRIINPDEVDVDTTATAKRRRSLGERQNSPKNRRSLGERQFSAQQIDVIKKSLFDITFGISDDPLSQFCVVFSALIHDVEHMGVPNAQLVKERNEIAIKFGEKSAAEQNSVHIAWEMLMEPKYDALRACIYTTDDEQKRFRQLVVNAVMATDIMDKELQAVRRRRWEKAFNEKETSELGSSFDRNRKATSVIEHIIQASDVAHTMQHWHIFRRWNEKLFDEMYIAYRQGRTDSDPSVGWYESQIGFFDYYIIPLARKLKECGVFGVAGDEYLSYALENRREWSLKGREESEVMMVNFHLKYGFWTEGDSKLREENRQDLENEQADDSHNLDGDPHDPGDEQDQVEDA